MSNAQPDTPATYLLGFLSAYGLLLGDIIPAGTFWWGVVAVYGALGLAVLVLANYVLESVTIETKTRLFTVRL